jgi:flavin-dependent dehydrogenase
LRDVVIIGGGLAGLITGIQLARANIACTLIERKKYPFHRVCGEYISNETLPFLKREGLFPEIFDLPKINRFELSSTNGNLINLPLDLGGFGISRYELDFFLYKKAVEAGVNFLPETEVEQVNFSNDLFTVNTATKTLYARIVIGAFGKRSKLDNQLNRNFFKRRSPYVGVKYHTRTDRPNDLIELHNFRGGYCGISNIENGKTNVCYLTHRDNVKKFKSISDMENGVLFENPHLKRIFNNSEFIFDKPEIINEISFETKEPVWNHILMTGDAAGMIAPLCGNGMSMAIHSGKILSAVIREHFKSENFEREKLEEEYKIKWNNTFKSRLWAGRQIQNKLFGSEWSSSIAVNLAIHFKSIARYIMKNTHGEPF